MISMTFKLKPCSFDHVYPQKGFAFGDLDVGTTRLNSVSSDDFKAYIENFSPN